jgi:acyl-CoA thioester hydrolase
MAEARAREGAAVGRVEHRVIFADTDALGIVYYANYLKYFEIGRAEWFRSYMEPFTNFIERDAYLIVVDAYCRHHSPARYDQMILIETRVGKIKRATFRFEYEIRDADTGGLLATGYTTHTVTDKNGKLRRFGTEFLDKVRSLASPD